MIDNKTSNLKLPLPHEDNLLEADVLRLRESLQIVDAGVHAAAKTADWDKVSGKPVDFPPAEHSHPAQATITGNAGSATKLETARTLQTNLASTVKVPFDGSANASPGVTGILPVANGGTGNATGTATKLATARTITLTGDVTGSVSFDGSKNVGIATTLAAGSGAVVMTITPTIYHLVAAGYKNTLSLHGVSLLSGGTVKQYRITYGATPAITVAAIAGAYTGDFTPVGAVGSAYTVKVVGIDVFGNESLPLVLNCTITASLVYPPVLISPVAGSTVYNSVTVATSPFATLGAADTHESTDWFLTSDAAGSVVVAQALASANKLSYTFTGLTVADGQTLYAWAVHKGKNLGKSVKSAGVRFVMKKGIFVAVGYGGYTTSSVDAITWTAAKQSFTALEYWEGVAYGAGKFVTVGDSGRISTSIDGVSWATPTVPTNFTKKWYAVAYGNGVFVAVGGVSSSGTSNGMKITTSTDGVTWTTPVNPNPSLPAACLDVVFADGKFVVVNAYGYSYMSTNGTSWRQSRITMDDSGLTNIAYGNGKFVVFAGLDKSSTSTDGITWTTPVKFHTTSWTNVNVHGVAWGNDKFVVACDRFSLTSPDGITWTEQPKIEYISWSKVRYLRDMFIASTGSPVVVLYSSSGTSWSKAKVVPLVDIHHNSYTLRDAAFTQ